MFPMYDEIIELEDQHPCCCVVLSMAHSALDGKKIVRDSATYES